MNVHRLDDASHVQREYATPDRMRRRLDCPRRLRFDELDEEQPPRAAVAERHPLRVLEAGRERRIPTRRAAWQVTCVDSAEVVAGRAPLQPSDGPRASSPTRAAPVFVAEAA